eukprot:463302-Hanusia_phi.AAC.6
MAMVGKVARCAAAMKGGIVADAASMGLHWIYDPEKIIALTRKAPMCPKDPAFFEPPSCPFYSYESGQLSPYGAEGLGMLKCMNSLPQHDPMRLAQKFAENLKAYSGRLNHASKELIANIEAGKTFPECGANDSQANALVKVPFALPRFISDQDWAARMEEVIRVHQNHELAVEYGMASSYMLHHIISTGATVKEALNWAASESSPLSPDAKSKVKEALAFTGNEVEAAKSFGSSCALPGAFTVAVYILNTTETYEEAIRKNIMASGDQCSRSCLIGACLAASKGVECVPDDWVGRVTDMEEIDKEIKEMCS